MSTPTNDIEHEDTCDNSASVWPVLLAGRCVLLGYFVGRISYVRDLRFALAPDRGIVRAPRDLHSDAVT